MTVIQLRQKIKTLKILRDNLNNKLIDHESQHGDPAFDQSQYDADYEKYIEVNNEIDKLREEISKLENK
jgi:hypothetical protein